MSLERRGGLHEPFSEEDRQHHAATLGMWVFLATEVMLFSGLFTTYAAFRWTWWSETFAKHSREMDLVLGTLNTGILLTSSLTMALAVHAAKAWRRGRSALLLAGTASLGAVFLCIKGYEWFQEYQHHKVPIDGLPFEAAAVEWQGVRVFMTHYFVMTGLHALHLLIGVGLVSALALRMWCRPPDNPNQVEMAGLYWHLVDVVWVFLYPLFYLVDRGGDL